MDVSDLQDSEQKAIMDTFVALDQKWRYKPNNARNLAEFTNEANEAFAKIGFLVHVQVADVLVGGPPTIEIIEKVGDRADEESKYGFDHERKRYDVLKSKVRNEDYIGQKERANAPKNK